MRACWALACVSVMCAGALAFTAVAAAQQTAPDSLARRLTGEQVAVGVPIGGSEGLLRDVQPGDRLDVLASIAAGQNDQPVTAVIVNGAYVLRPPSSGDPLLLAVPASDALMLAHIVLGGTHLGYLLWPTQADSAPEPQPLAEPTARALLDLPRRPDQR